MQARSQDLKKGGGLFWKSEKTANVLDPNFRCSWIRITRFIRFLPIYSWNWDENFGQNRKFKRFFSPKTGDLKKKKKKKKKGLHRNWDGFFGQNWKFKRFFRPNHDIYFTTSAPNFLWGRLFSFFTKNRPQKHQKVRFYIHYRPMGGLELPPPPPPCQRYCLNVIISFCIIVGFLDLTWRSEKRIFL